MAGVGGGGGGGGGGWHQLQRPPVLSGKRQGRQALPVWVPPKKRELQLSQASKVGTIRTNNVVSIRWQKYFSHLTLKKQIVGMGMVPIMAQHKLAGRLAYHLSNWQVLTKDQ